MPKTNPLSQLESKSRVISGAAAKSVASNVTLHASPLNSEINSTTINFTVQGLIGEGGLIGENGLTGQVGLIGENGIPVFNNNGLIGEGGLVASLQDAQTRSAPIPSSPQPTLLTDLDDPTSTYTVLTGLKTGSPTVVFTSEFIPLYEPLELSSNTKLTPQGDSLKLKQEAKLITAATAVSVLSQSLPVQNLVNTNKQNIKTFLDGLGTGNKTDISNFVSELYDLSPKFNPSSYTFTPPAAPKFSILLSRLGYSFVDISKFSETKIWLQSLFELKKSLLTHTPSIQSYDRTVGGTSAYDNDTNLVSKFVGERVVLNMSSPNLLLLEGTEISEIVNSYPEYEDDYALYDSIMYSKLNKLEDLTDNDFRVGTYVLRPDDEIDFSIAASNVLKEIKYCDNFAEDYIRPALQADFSYPLSERKNYKVWDSLIGRIPLNARDSLTDSNSLSSLCQFLDTVSETPVTVYTFEKNPATSVSINNDAGFRYFIEGSLDSLDTTGQADVSRINVLEEKCVKSLKAINSMITIVGADNLGAYSNLIDRVFRRLSTENNSPGWMYLKNITSNLPDEIRIPSLIMKLSLRTDVPYLRSLKMHLFTWFYFQARKISEPSRDYSSSIQFALDKVLEDVYGWRVPSPPGALEAIAYRLRSGYQTGTPADDVDNLFKRNVRIFLEDSPVTKLILDEFVSFLNDIRAASIDGATAYSGLQIEKMMYAYFDVMMRAIAFQTVESIERVYYTTSTLSSSALEIGITVKLVERTNYDAYYERGYSSGPTLNYLKRLKSVYTNVYQDVINRSQYLQTFKSFLERLRDAARRAKSLISEDQRLKRYFNLFGSVFDAEDQNFFQNPSATKKRMFKYSLSAGQARNLDYVHSEMRERINENQGMQNSLRQSPTVSGLFPSKDFTNFLPLNPVSLVSHQILSKLYNDVSFQPVRGNNKRIISVGIPHGLVSKIQSESSSRNPVSSGLVTLKVWKIDRLYPDVLFRPLTYVFDMNLYPTRSPSNWDFETLATSPNVLNIPLKYYSPTSKYFYTKSKFISPNDPEFLTTMDQQDITYLNLAIPDSEKEVTLRKIYENHALSYLCEEYLGWYTDEDFSEMQYHNYYNKPSTRGRETYQEVINSLRNNLPSFAQNSVKFTDFSTGQVITFPVSTLQTASTTSQRVSSPVQTVDLTDTAVSYLRNLSFMSKVQNIKKRIIFPKKFERVFNILIDPDDFQIESTFDPIKKANLLLGPFEEVSGIMKRRETTPDEISLNEFFVTIEPFDYEPTRSI